MANITTVTLDGGELRVEGLGGQNTAIINRSDGAVYASAYPDIVPRGDDIIEIAAGDRDGLYDANGTVYLLGTGKFGSTGMSTGPHLHFTLLDNWDKKPNIYYSGDLLDPVKELGLGTLKYASSDKLTTSATSFKVGDIVEFTGSTHYTSSTGTRGTACKPGKAKITRIADGAAHPLHLVNDGSGSTVYGWVNAADVQPVTKKSVDEIAREVIRGDWGNGDVRKKRLTAAGYNYTEVQAKVDKLMK